MQPSDSSRSNLGRDLQNEPDGFGMGASRPHNPAVWGELGGALPRPQDTEPKQQQKTDLKHKESDSPVFRRHHRLVRL